MRKICSGDPLEPVQTLNNSGHYEPEFSCSQQKTIVSGPPLLFHQTFPFARSQV